MSALQIPGAGFRSVLSVVGFILSVYAVYVEWKVHTIQASEDLEGGFSALCDIDAIGASCRCVLQKSGRF